ncbi:hypothetical protein RFI_16738 [Reticulomyxa filosa]|uniref:Uncharacterized protein n=1 Tax=Reticulomyxa filosa TaxID=46433 RepID=X6N3L0_RETFI|nr:hypothetical protein RFI_16738 [Reticulomyxa filosa]|eukprot:ETO20478.1 hypothetical protein RFI_16738 [Reticulomyxa filosa]
MIYWKNMDASTQVPGANGSSANPGKTSSQVSPRQESEEGMTSFGGGDRGMSPPLAMNEESPRGTLDDGDINPSLFSMPQSRPAANSVVSVNSTASNGGNASSSNPTSQTWNANRPPKKLHFWRVTLRGKKVKKMKKTGHLANESVYVSSPSPVATMGPLNGNENMLLSSSYFDWLTLKLTTTSSDSFVGMRTTHYQDKDALAGTTAFDSRLPSQRRHNLLLTGFDEHETWDPAFDSESDAILKKPNYVTCSHKLDNAQLLYQWNLLVVTGLFIYIYVHMHIIRYSYIFILFFFCIISWLMKGRKRAIDGPISMVWYGNSDITVRKIGKMHACVDASCLQFVGSDGNPNELKYCCGRVADVMIWDGVLSKLDILQLYSALFNSYK